MEIKKELLHKCKEFVDNRLKTVQETISSHQKALQSETKSSAGDKHETGRAMLQLEMEKASQQLSNIYQMKETLAKINVSKTSNIAHLGSIIETNVANYFLSISAGQLVVAKKMYFAVSVSSPIGKLLLGKRENAKIFFNQKAVVINSIN
ncbi:3-oxoacyl-ACP synthase [Polaribacter porphyrae]|uniref:3-oxoacyl-ACP synthase n=1 Tax=Polaribacter porphyrae TaxID=1137780 RepID=A0A2S7WQJ6_9FLAO|nr:3-oxoacyl-ACP synthase [Polaribacter porphyrae]PQJ79890.1 3-oxoacyl-ACP synthase [Polaribacter porphyrae]